MHASPAQPASSFPRRLLGKAASAFRLSALDAWACPNFTVRPMTIESIATIHHALDQGINFLDTADVYGQRAQRGVGRPCPAGAARPRPCWPLSSETCALPTVSWLGVNGRPEYVSECCNASLRRLGVSHIDLYYQHRVDPDTPHRGNRRRDVTAGANKAKSDTSVFPKRSAETLRRAAAVHPIAALQSEYSLWTRDPEAEILPPAASWGSDLSPTARLAADFSPAASAAQTDLEACDYRRRSPRFQGENLDRNLAMVQQASSRLASEKRCTPAQLALAWLLARGDDIVPIAGTKRRGYLDENVGAVQVKLQLPIFRAWTVPRLAELPQARAIRRKPCSASIFDSRPFPPRPASSLAIGDPGSSRL